MMKTDSEVCQFLKEHGPCTTTEVAKWMFAGDKRYDYALDNKRQTAYNRLAKLRRWGRVVAIQGQVRQDNLWQVVE